MVNAGSAGGGGDDTGGVGLEDLLVSLDGDGAGLFGEGGLDGIGSGRDLDVVTAIL